jgi:hypothetical protein
MVRQAMERHERLRTAAKPEPAKPRGPRPVNPDVLAAARAAVGIKLPPPSEKLLQSLHTEAVGEDDDQPAPAQWIEPMPWEEAEPTDDDDVPFPDEDEAPTRLPERVLP